MKSTLLNRKGPHAAGWTVLELMLIVGIIAVLMVLGFAGTRSMGRKGQEVKCVHHLRQLGTAYLAYTADVNRGVIKSQVGGGNITFGWSRLIVSSGYITGPTPWGVMQCPSAPLPESARTAMSRYNPKSPNLGVGDVWRWYVYGLNMCAITGRTKVTKVKESAEGAEVSVYELAMANVPSPALHVLFADSTSGSPNFWPSQALERDNPRGLALRHGPKSHPYANAFFLDGHISQIDRERSKELATAKYHYGLNLPQPFVFDVQE